MTNPNECGECKVLNSVGHGRLCSKYVAPLPIAWSADGFVRNAMGPIAGFADGNATNPVHAALNGWVTAVTAAPAQTLMERRIAQAHDAVTRYAEIGNGLFVRVGTGAKKRRRAA